MTQEDLSPKLSDTWTMGGIGRQVIRNVVGVPSHTDGSRETMSYPGLDPVDI